MLLVKTKLGTSGIHGMGLFADQFIPKGTPTWRYTPWFDIAFSEEQMKEMSESARKQIMHYHYFDQKTQKYILCSDDQRFINHANDPIKRNIESTPNEDMAIRDIKPGEELLCDYNKFDDTYFNRIGFDKESLI